MGDSLVVSNQLFTLFIISLQLCFTIFFYCIYNQHLLSAKEPYGYSFVQAVHEY